jgi:hypothetical protein
MSSTQSNYLNLVKNYKEKFKQVSKEQGISYRKAFIAKHNWEDANEAYTALNNFLNGNSLRSGYIPPYEFIDKLNKFYYQLTNETL